MSYPYHEQTCATYRDESYGSGTIYSSGCGPASLCNALDCAGVESITVRDMCAFSVKCGARVTGGTDMDTLLRNAVKRWKFTYKATNSRTELYDHLTKGFPAILHAGDSFKLFSDGGHFVCAADITDNRMTVLDSYWYDGKYTKTSLRRNNASVLARGIVRVDVLAAVNACADRFPRFYLIKPIIEPKEENEVIYKTLNDVPSYYKEAVELLIKHGSLKGTGDGIINLPESTCRELTLLMREGILQKKYKTLDEIPSYYKEAIQELIDSGCLHGVSADNLNLTESECRIYTVLHRKEHSDD